MRKELFTVIAFFNFNNYICTMETSGKEYDKLHPNRWYDSNQEKQ